jgi:hypothetical protein
MIQLFVIIIKVKTILLAVIIIIKVKTILLAVIIIIIKVKVLLIPFDCRGHIIIQSFLYPCLVLDKIPSHQ